MNGFAALPSGRERACTRERARREVHSIGDAYRTAGEPPGNDGRRGAGPAPARTEYRRS